MKNKKDKDTKNYGLKFRIYPNENQKRIFEDHMETSKKFWNILVYEQMKGLFVKREEEYEIFEKKYKKQDEKNKQTLSKDDYEEERKKLWKLVRDEWIEKNPTFYSVFNGCPEERKKFIADKYNDEKIKKFLCQEDYDEFIQYLENNVDRYNDFKCAPRNRGGICSSFDSFYKYATKRIYQNNTEPLNLPSKIALGVVAANVAAWDAFSWKEMNFPNFKNKNFY